MKRIYCDVCGKAMEEHLEGAHYAGNGTTETGYYGLMVRNMDVCPLCMTVGRRMDMERIMLEEWKERAVF